MSKDTIDKKVIDLFRRIAMMNDVQKDNRLNLVGKEVINIDDNNNEYQGTDSIFNMDEIELDNFILECNELLR